MEIDSQRTQLSLAGSFYPSWNGGAASIDREAMVKLCNETVRALLRSMAKFLEEQEEAAAASKVRRW